MTPDPKPCSHQYWDLGRCIGCFKTQFEIDSEKRNPMTPPDPRLALPWRCPKCSMQFDMPVDSYQAHVTYRCAQCGEWAILDGHQAVSRLLQHVRVLQDALHTEKHFRLTAETAIDDNRRVIRELEAALDVERRRRPRSPT